MGGSMNCAKLGRWRSVEQGHHQELPVRGGLGAEWYNSQFEYAAVN